MSLDGIVKTQGACPETTLLWEASVQLGLNLSDQQLAQLLQHRDALLKWNRVYNLTSIRDPQDMFRQHLIDCLAVVPALQRQLTLVPEESGRAEQGVLRPKRVLDVGSGGGLPGVVLAVCMPDVAVDCIDAVAKKVAFIRQVGAELGLGNLTGVHGRVETLPSANDRLGSGYDVITSRAFSSLVDFTNWTAHLLSRTGVWAAMKGQDPHDERHALGQKAELFHVEPLHPPGLNAQRCLIWMRPASRRAGERTS
jgi:16S rRNA (guanine527-N7)-methyltransferase